MTDEQETKLAFARSLSNAGLCHAFELEKKMETQPAWWQRLRHKIGLLLDPPDTRKPSRDAVQYADYILNHYSRNSQADKICLARDLERHGWKGHNVKLRGCALLRSPARMMGWALPFPR